MRRKLALLVLCVAVLVSVSFVSASLNTAQANGMCFSGLRYGAGGTDHNYVEIQVNVSSTKWHTHKPWWAFPISLWTFPDSHGIARAGINGTDNDPWYSASNYQLCTG